MPGLILTLCAPVTVCGRADVLVSKQNVLVSLFASIKLIRTFSRMWKVIGICILALVIETTGRTGEPKYLGRGSGRMKGRGGASLGSRQRGAIR